MQEIKGNLNTKGADVIITKELEEKLIAKERSILAAQKRRDLADIESLLALGFHEISTSGRLLSKRQVLEGLQFVHVLDYSLENFRVLPIDTRCVVVTYVVTMRRRHKGAEYSGRSYRSSTWIERNGTWRMIFHQGTPLPGLDENHC